jgi:hypothetical protein
MIRMKPATRSKPSQGTYRGRCRRIGTASVLADQYAVKLGDYAASGNGLRSGQSTTRPAVNA